MAKSLDHLIRFLLEEIALAGSHGIPYNAFTDLVHTFYDDSKHLNKPESFREINGKNTTDEPRQNIDRLFLAKVWTWLVKHPDVSVGPDHDYDNLNLDELEARFPGYTTTKTSTQTTAEGDVTLVNVESAVGPQIHVSKERAYLAICGHPPDPTKVFPSEWNLLCAIAATREYGILQGELGRITGQDKRSVPKRTDTLQEKGYIVKKIVYTGGHKTSRLILKRFAFGTDAGSSNDSPSYLGPKVKDIALRILAAIKGGQIVPIDDIAQTIGMNEPRQVIALTSIIRYFVRAGCLKKVKTVFGPAAKSEDMKICYQLIRQPTIEEWHTSANTSFDFDDLFDELVAATSDALPETPAGSSDANDDDLRTITEQTSRRPQWNIDRILPNVIRDVAQAAGIDGMTNASARNVITGPFVRRTLEASLVRLSHAAPISQPDQVRHLAVVRRSEVKDSAPTYVHRSIDIYRDMVTSGKADWKDVGTSKDITKAEKNAELANQSFPHDAFGFVVRAKPNLLVGDGDVSLSDTIAVAKAADLKPGSTKMVLQPTKTTPDDQDFESESLEKTRRKYNRAKTRDGTILGRPRKFKKGTEKFWREMFMIAKREANPNTNSTVGAAGIMVDPAGLKVFNNRPTEFDDALLHAINNDLPIPCRTKDISQQWVDRTKQMRDRQVSGWYTTITGMTNESRSRRSCVCVLRSRRLHEVDFFDRVVPSTVLFNVSNVAHSSHFRRFYPQLHSVPDSVVLDLYLPGYGPESKKPSSRASKPKGQELKEVEDARTYPRTRGRHNVDIAPAPAAFFGGPFRADSSITGPVSVSRNSPASMGVGAGVVGSSPEKITRHDASSVELATTSVSSVVGGPAASSDTENRRSSSKITRSASAKHKGIVKQQLPQQPTLADSQDLRNQIRALDGIEKSNSSLSDPTEIQVHRETTNASSPEQQFEDVGQVRPLLNPGDLRMSHQLNTSRFDSKEPSGRSSTSASRVQLSATTVSDPGKPLDRYESHNHIRNGDSIPEANTSQTPGTEDPILSACTTHPPSGVNAPEAHLSEAQVDNRPANHSSTLTNKTVDTPGRSESSENRGRRRGPKPDWPASVAPTQEDDEYHVPAEEVADTPNPRKRKRVTKSTKLKKRSKELLTGRSAVAYYREFIMQLVLMCQGVMPYGPPMLKRAMKTKCIEANVDDDPNIKLVKSQIKALCDQGKLKQMYISFQWNGAIHTKQILALPEITGTDTSFQDMTTKITSMPPEEDHVPPEMQAEQARHPIVQETAEDTESASDEQSVIESSARRPKRTRLASERVRTSSVAHQDDDLPQNESSDPEHSLSSPKDLLRRPRRAQAPPSTKRRSPASQPKFGPNTGFLTLKVPRIASVRAEAAFTSHYFTLPPVPLRFNADATSVEAPSSDVAPAENFRQSNSLRSGQPRRAKPVPLPKTLNEILGQDKRDHGAEIALAANPELARFDIEVDWVAEWEMRAHEQNMEELEPGIWYFINHEVLEQKNAYSTANVFSSLRIICFNDNGLEVEQDPPEMRSWRPFVEALHHLEQGPVKMPRRTGRIRKRKPVEFEEYDDDDDDDADADADAEYELEDDARPDARQNKRPRKSAAVIFRGRRDPANYDNALTVDKTRRRGQGLRNLSQQEVHRLSVAIVIVRVLTGGLHHYIDWSLVARLCPDETLSTLKQRWKVIAARFMPDIDALSQSLQVRYLDALANDEVPSINFEDINNSDWQGILEWAVRNIDTKSKAMTFGLLSTREDLLETHKVTLEERDNIRHLQAHGMLFTGQMRESAIYSVVFGTAIGLRNEMSSAAPSSDLNLQTSERTAREVEDVSTEQSLARSFVLASILTPPETFSSLQTHEKLLKLVPEDKNAAEHLVSSALAALSRDRLISKRNRNANTEGPTSSGTKDWMLNTQRFHMALVTHRMVTAPMLQAAAHYKLSVLDVAFRSAQKVVLAKGIADRDDGEMLAILNLLSMNMIHVRPGADVPASRYGLDWQRQGYKTKSMDHSVLEFSVVLEPTREYVHGNLLERQLHLIEIPEGKLRQDDGRGRIPAWFDINLDFRAELWELYIGAVIGLVSLRPGITVLEICKTLSWVLAQDDVAMIIGWLEQAGAVKGTGSEGHCETTEWWWMILGKHRR